MSTEYYIRQPESETARGPFTIDKLISLAEADQIDRDTLYYDEPKEAWVAIAANEEMRRQIFPERKKLTLRPKTKEELNLLNREEEELTTAPVKVEDMLAAAEGDTEETRHYRRREVHKQRSASLAIPIIGSLLVVSAVSNILPSWDLLNEVIATNDPFLLVQKPLLVLGLVDLFFAVCIFLAATEIYPFLRFRMMAGLGYFAAFYYAKYLNHEDPMALYTVFATAAGAVSLFTCTLTLNLWFMIFFGLVGVGGMGAFSYFTFFRNLLG